MADSDNDVDTMSVKALRALIAAAGLSHADCLEKADLRARAREALAVTERNPVPSSACTDTTASRPQQAPRDSPHAGSAATDTTTTPGPLHTKTETLAGFSCVIKAPKECFDAACQPDLAVIILHGFGATNDDFVSVPDAAMRGGLGRRVLWVFPQAPTGDLNMSAWWSIDPMKWMAATMGGDAGLAQLLREEPKGLAECRRQLTELVNHVERLAHGLPTSRLVLGGFSQGAMTALDLALSLDRTVAGVTVLSGAPIVIEQWAERLKNHRGLRVFVTHGQSDMVLPFKASGWLKDLLQTHGASVRYEAHSGGHELAHNTVPQLIEFWRDL